MLQDTARLAVSIIVQMPAEGPQTASPPLHRQIRDHLQKRISEAPTPSAKRAEDSIARETKFLQSSLSQFLTTPLRSDAAEVNRIFGEAFSRCLKEGCAGTAPRVVTSASGTLLSPREINEQLKPLADTGLEYLEHTLAFRITPEVCVTEVTALLDGGVSPALVLTALDDTVTRIPRVTSYRTACGGVTAPAESAGAANVGGSAYESVLTFHIPRSAGTTLTTTVGDAVSRFGDESGLLAYSVWKMLTPYSFSDTLQLRMVWGHEEGMTDGVQKIVSIGEVESFRTVGGGFAAWFKHMME